MLACGSSRARVIGHQDLAALLAPFGMIVQVDPDQDQALQTAQRPTPWSVRSRRTPAGPRTLTGSKAQTRPTWSGWGLAPVKGRPGQAPAVGDLADYLLLRHHSAVELIGRAEAGRLVERWRDDSDGRVIRVRLTGDGERRLSQLAPAHLDELRRLAPILDQVVVGDG
jgi:hypothetical protein